MKRQMLHSMVLAVFLLPVLGSTAASAAQDIGAVVALRGSADIEREAKMISAKLREGIQLMDIVETRAASRTKMLFIDDSVLTLGEKSRAGIRDFVYSKDKGGSSIFNLIDGKMRAVVGKASFEVHTPTVVTAARGTVIEYETGKMDGKYFTTVTCLEGEVEIRSIDPSVMGKIFLGRGMTVTVVAGQPLPAPKPAVKTAMGGAAAEELPSDLPLNQAPPVNQQPAGKATSPLGIEIRFP